jgi:hypothetical protein
MGAEPVGDLGRVPRFVLAAIQDDANFAVVGKGLEKMHVEFHLTPRHDDEPPLGGLAIAISDRLWLSHRPISAR